MSVRVQTADFDIGQEILRIREGNPRIGAVASFIGLVRDINDNAAVSEMTLEHYSGMTEKALEAIIIEAKQRWEIIDTMIIHRVGKLKPTDQIVLVIVAGEHRGAAFSACEFIMDYLKTRAPFWKKEITQAGEKWVDAKAGDDSAAMRWENK